MLGAIVGDIVGSIYEWDNIKTKDFPLFKDECFFTDDTVMTVAVADALLAGGTSLDFIEAFKKWGRLYPDAGYGGRFFNWIMSDSVEPYNSWGNGSAMRVSPCGWVDGSSQKARLSAMVTHNHPEGVKGALAVADLIYMGRSYKGMNGFTLEGFKDKIKEYIEGKYGYDLSLSLDEIRPSYTFDVSCKGTVPPAIIAFLESTDFEDSIRNAISLGGDSDTLGAITGSIAEAFYGIPSFIKETALSYLDEPLREVYLRFTHKYSV